MATTSRIRAIRCMPLFTNRRRWRYVERMKHAMRFAAMVCVTVLLASCASSAGGPDKDVVPEHFMPRDLERLERFGGTYVPMGEGALATKTPVLSVHFNEQRLDDRDFYDVFPGLQRMDPLTL